MVLPEPGYYDLGLWMNGRFVHGLSLRADTLQSGAKEMAMEKKPTIRLLPRDPNDPRSKGITAKQVGNMIWIDIGPEWMLKEPRPAPPMKRDDTP